MRADDFNGIFDEVVLAPLEQLGWSRSSATRLRIEAGPVRVVLARTEPRFNWPFALTLLVTHAAIRDFHDRLDTWPGEPSEYVVKAQPSTIGPQWRYEPHNLVRVPSDEMTEQSVRQQLVEISANLQRLTPDLETLFSASALLGELEAHGEDAWCERRWAEDLRAYVGH